MSEMRVCPEFLAGSAQSIAHCAEDFGNDLDLLDATLTTGSPWGNDEQGSLFGAAYTEVLSHALEAYGSHVGLLVTAAEGLTTWAVRAAETEQKIHQQVASIDAGMDA